MITKHDINRYQSTLCTTWSIPNNSSDMNDDYNQSNKINTPICFPTLSNNAGWNAE